jgi:hypothetical protein
MNTGPSRDPEDSAYPAKCERGGRLIVSRKKFGELPMKAVAAPTEEQLSLDFEGRTPRKVRVKAARVKQAPASIDIPEKPKR